MALQFQCSSPVQGCAMRITRENECGVVFDPLTPQSRIQTNDFVMVTDTPQVEDGTTFMLRNACGLIPTFYKDIPRVTYDQLTLGLTRVNLPMLEMLLDADLLAAPDDPTEFIGWVRSNDLTKPNPNPKLLEVQSRNAARDQCGVGGTGSAAVFRHVWPWTANWVINTEMSVDNENPFTITLQGDAFNNPNFFPSYPDADYPSWEPGGGDPDGVPTGPPPPDIPGGMDADPIPLEWQAQIQDGGPYFGFSEAGPFFAVSGDLADSCNYVGLGS